MTSSATSPDEQAFVDWFKAKGGTVHDAVGFKQWEGQGRGCVALQDIEPDTVLFSIPRPILLTTSTSALPSLLPAEEWAELAGWTPLILSMMYEYLRTTTWKPYFALLPTQFDSLMFWSDEELAELQGSTVLSKIGRDEADQAFVETVKPLVEKHANVFGDPKDYSAELFHRMGSLVLSRSFHVDSKPENDDEEKEDEDSDDEEEEREDVADVAMVPFADILNAKSGADNARLFYEPTTLNMMSTSHIPAGAQIYNTYADPPNSDLLRRYGHVDEVNDSDLVEVGLETVVDLVGEARGMSEEEREARAEWLLEMGIDDTFSVETDHKLPDELVSAIRAFLLTDEEYAKAQKKESPPKPKLDADAAEWGRKILDKRLREYKTSIQEDEELLKQTDLPVRRRLAVIVRLGEKRLLVGARAKLDADWPQGKAGPAAKEKKRSREGKEEGRKKKAKQQRSDYGSVHTLKSHVDVQSSRAPLHSPGLAAHTFGCRIMAGKLQAIKADLKAKRRLSGWVLPKPESAFTPSTHWSNYDMEPVPPEHATWTKTTIAAYWFSDLISAGTWSQISSFVALGLTWWQGLLATFLGAFLIAIVISLNGLIGARLHTPFAVTSRAAFGIMLSRFAVVSRLVIAWFWFSVNSYQGGTAVRLCLIAIWPSFKTFPNHLPESAGVTSSGMLCFFLFWLFQFPMLLIHPRHLRPIFLLKACTLPIVAVGMMAWTIHTAGDRASEVMRAPSKISGLNGFYLFMSSVTSAQGTWSTMAINIGDFTRYSKRESSAWLQVAVVPALWTTAALFGAVSANMTSVIPRYAGQAIFQPFDIIEGGGWLDSHGGRAAAFFCSAAWGLGNACTNITSNSISSANDLASLFPKWISIFRGQIICAVIGAWAFAPWKVLSSASSFVSFMASYSIVLSPIAAILCADFFLVKKSKYDVVQLYDPNGIYHYEKGFNLRALAALVIAIPPNVPGMAHALNENVDIGGAKYIFCVADIFGMTVAASVHVGLSKLFPDRDSIVAEAVLAQDVLEGRAPGYEHLARKDLCPTLGATPATDPAPQLARSTGSSEEATDELKDEKLLDIEPVA